MTAVPLPSEREVESSFPVCHSLNHSLTRERGTVQFTSHPKKLARKRNEEMSQALEVGIGEGEGRAVSVILEGKTETDPSRRMRGETKGKK